MAQPIRLPRYNTDLGDFLGDLRAEVFRDKSSAARYFGLSHSTLSRYESGAFRPELGYLAALAQMAVERLEDMQQEVEEYQKQLLHEINSAIRGDYEDDRPFRTWSELQQAAEAYMAQRNGKQAAQDGPDQSAQNGQQPAEPATSQNGSAAPADAATAPQPQPLPSQQNNRSRTTTPVRRTKQRQNRQTIIGADVQAVNVNGTVKGPVIQYQPRHTHNHAPPSDRKTAGDSDESLTWVFLLLLAAVGSWLLQRAPGLSIGMLLLLSGWRAARHLWRIKQLRAQGARSEEMFWQMGHTFAWVGALAWTVFMASRIPTPVPSSTFTFERLILLFTFIVISLYVFLLSIIDVLLWSLQTTGTWLSRLFQPYGERYWDQRWFLLGVTLLVLVFFSVWMLMFGFRGGL
jgi:transcriptional regulator with XRE-family HTH domain